eukprot:768630-Rhodomonas_salina.1
MLLAWCAGVGGFGTEAVLVCTESWSGYRSDAGTGAGARPGGVRWGWYKGDAGTGQERDREEYSTAIDTAKHLRQDLQVLIYSTRYCLPTRLLLPQRETSAICYVRGIRCPALAYIACVICVRDVRESGGSMA